MLGFSQILHGAAGPFSAGKVPHLSLIHHQHKDAFRHPVQAIPRVQVPCWRGRACEARHRQQQGVLQLHATDVLLATAVLCHTYSASARAVPGYRWI